MDNKVDGTLLKDMRQWRCNKNKNHVLGVIEHEEVKVLVQGRTLRYNTARLIIFREAVDQAAEIPADIDVAGIADGKMLSIVWKCSVPGCGCPKEWQRDDDVLEYLVKTYLSE